MGLLDATRAPVAHVVVADLDRPELDADDARHLAAVLRLRPGEAVGATDGRGGWRPCRFGGGAGFGSGAALEPDGEVIRVEPPTPRLTVGFVPVKGDRPEWAVQKLTEIGVDRIVVLRGDRGVVRWEGSRAIGHLERLRRVAGQALRQSRGVWLPEVVGVVDVGSLAGESAGTAGAGLAGVGLAGVGLAEPGGRPPALSLPTVLVGPEGGWSEAELGLGLPTVGLGPTILRAETAAVAAGLMLAGLRAGVVAEVAGARR